MRDGRVRRVARGARWALSFVLVALAVSWLGRAPEAVVRIGKPRTVSTISGDEGSASIFSLRRRTWTFTVCSSERSAE